MKNKVLSLLLLFVAFVTSVFADDNVAYRDNTVRFTLISDGTIRLEYSPSGQFTDAPSFLAVERDYPEVKAKVKSTDKWLTIETPVMVVKYLKNSGKFTAKNLSITSAKGFFPFSWKPGDKQQGNLKGTYRTLDNYDGEFNDDGKPMPIEDGILATDGWTFLDDSENLLFDDSDFPWAMERKNKKGQDWYFMAYGHDYKKALKDFTRFAGRMPLPPRYAFGYWWSRYWCYSDNELRTLVKTFQNYNIPLDVLVIDMDWHYTEQGKGGWTGYTWNRSLFPNPAGTLKFIKDNNLQITMNLHPADGIRNYEEKYAEMKKWMGLPDNYNGNIDHVSSDKRYMTGWLNTILHPMEKQGVDFWWLDWQQHIYDNKMSKLHNTWWLNYTFFTDMERNRETRPMLYHRWGGLGNHRYQIGFSGDSDITWNSLDFQPYFNSTASNVLYGYWSHDIGGHHFGIGRIEPEMYIRWMQFGMLSPILRTHSTKNEALKKEPWMFDNEQCNILRNCIKTRYDLSPYIYSMARKAYEEGLSICRPMYYDYPEAKEAYEFRNEYMFGDQMLVMPITQPMQGQYSVVKVWLPEGNDWYEWHTGTTLKGGQVVERRFALDEYPIYIKSGAIIPMSYNLKNLRSNDSAYTINLFPGQGGEFSLYEDNGNDKHYATEYATTHLKSTFEGNELVLRIAPRQGNYKEMPENRRYNVQVNGYAVPQIVTVNGRQAAFEYDGNALALHISLDDTDCLTEKEVRITYNDQQPIAVDNGLLSKFRRIQKTMLALKYRKAGLLFKEEFAKLESAGQQMHYYPDTFGETLQQFNSSYARLPEILNNLDLNDEQRRWFLESIDWKAE